MPENPSINAEAAVLATRAALALMRGGNGLNVPLARECLARALAMLGPSPAPALIESPAGTLEWYMPKPVPESHTSEAGASDSSVSAGTISANAAATHSQSPSDSTLAGAEAAIMAHEDAQMTRRAFGRHVAAELPLIDTETA